MEKIKFELHEKVKLPEAISKGIVGIITAIFIGDMGISYKVRYFWQGEAKEVYFYGWELDKTNE